MLASMTVYPHVCGAAANSGEVHAQGSIPTCAGQPSPLLSLPGNRSIPTCAGQPALAHVCGAGRCADGLSPRVRGSK